MNEFEQRDRFLWKVRLVLIFILLLTCKTAFGQAKEPPWTMPVPNSVCDYRAANWEEYRGSVRRPCVIGRKLEEQKVLLVIYSADSKEIVCIMIKSPLGTTILFFKEEAYVWSA